MRREKNVEHEFDRSVAEERPVTPDRDPVDRDRHYGGAPLDDVRSDVDPDAEASEWESRYGSEESRDKLGFDGGK